MMQQLDAPTFLERGNTVPIIDVRTPAEYEKGHIPGAINIALFSNEERAVVGTAYKQINRYEALLQGLDFVGPKMRSFVETSQALAHKKHLLVHCWRGGMRSESFAWLLQTAGLQPAILKGGYKAYRRHIFSEFAKPAYLIVLSGATGSGKTQTLHQLQQLGEQIIDLEGLAIHKGSAFGGIGQGKQPTTEQFQNELYLQWKKIDLHRRVWIEDESLNIGRVKIPDPLWFQMKTAPVIALTLPKPVRIQRLVSEYGRFDVAELRQAILKIHKRLGGLATQEALTSLKAYELNKIADILLTYYDKNYLRSLQKRAVESVHYIASEVGDSAENAGLIKDFVNSINV